MKLNEFLEQYDQISLSSSLATLENTAGWELFRAYVAFVQRRYEVDALDMIAKHDMQHAAAYASGYAKGVSDLTESFIQGLRETIAGKTQLVENSRPEE